MTSLSDDAGTVLVTERLRIRDWDISDADRMLDMYSRPDVVRFLGSAPTPMRSREETLERIATRGAWNAAQRGAGTPFGWWAIHVADADTVCGTVALLPLGWSEEPDAEVEVAWHLHPEAQGHGYATEAARAVLTRAHEAGLAQIVALTDAANTASQAVCRRLGLEHVETSDRYYGKRLLVWCSRA